MVYMKYVGNRKTTYKRICANERRCGGNYLKILTRDCYTCVLCGNDYFPVVHHLDGNIKNNKMDNLLSVCKYCHAKLHGLTISIKNPRVGLIIELHEQNKTFQEIGDYLGISRQRVHQIIKRDRERSTT